MDVLWVAPNHSWPPRTDHASSFSKLFSVQADFFTKIRSTWDNNYVGSAEESLNKPFCGTLNATQETTFYGKWWVP